MNVRKTGAAMLQRLFEKYLNLLRRTVAVRWDDGNRYGDSQIYGFWHEDSFFMNLVLERLADRTTPVDVIVTADARGNYIEYMVRQCGGNALRVPDGYGAFTALKKIVKDSYETVRERLSDYERLMGDFHEKVIRRNRIELADTLLIAINARAIRDIADEGEHLYRSFSDLVLYATGAAACSTADLLMVLDAINTSLDNIQRHLNRSYFETWRYVQVRIGYWKEQVYRRRSIKEMAEDAFSRWRVAGKLDY